MGITAAVGVVGAAASAASAAHSLAQGSKSSSTQAAADQANANAEADKQQALQYWQNVTTPTFNTTPFQTQSVVGTLTPQTYNPYIGQVQQIQDDTANRDNQQAAIAQLQQYAKGGLQPSDIAALNQIESSQAGADTSQNNSLLAQMQARGQGGAGSQYALEAANNQATSNNANSLYASALQTALQRQLA